MTRECLTLHGLPRDIIGKPFTCDVTHGIIRYVDCHMSSWTRADGQIDKYWWAVHTVDLDEKGLYEDGPKRWAVRKMIILNVLFEPLIPGDAVFVGVINDVIELQRHDHTYQAERFYLYDMGYTDKRIERTEKEEEKDEIQDT